MVRKNLMDLICKHCFFLVVSVEEGSCNQLKKFKPLSEGVKGEWDFQIADLSKNPVVNFGEVRGPS